MSIDQYHNKIICEICGKAVQRTPFHMKRAKHHFCSRECHRKSKIGQKRPRHALFMKNYWETHQHPLLGKEHSPATKEKMRQKWSPTIITEGRNSKISLAMSKEKNPNWRGGPKIPRDMRNAIRKRREYKNWRSSVFQRDAYTCRSCGSKNGSGKAIALEAHHIMPFIDYPLFRWDPQNGLTLCRPCHQNFHSGDGEC